MRNLVASLVVLTLLSELSGAEKSDRAESPNIVFILADDLGWADTTLYGHTQFYRTPQIERLAKRGMTFTRAYSASPLCSPTRSAILTGLSPARTGLTTPNCHLPQVVLEAKAGQSAPPNQKAIQPQPVTRLKTEYRTLAETLKEAGYATGHFGKWHLGPEPFSPLQQGFDVDVPHHPGPGPAGSYVAPWKFKDFDHDPDVPHQHIEDRMAQEAVSWMEKNKDRPFFLNYWMFSVHAPFDAKKTLIEKYRSRVNPKDPQRSPTYAAMIESMDDAVGTLLNALDRLGLSEKTIIVFTSDNGGNMYNEVDGTTPTSNAPLRGGKATMFEGGTRVPCVICWPGIIKPNTRSDILVQSEDFYPTLLEALNLKPLPNQPFDGVSLLPVLQGQPIARESVFQYFPHSPPVPDWLPPSVSVHQGDWKLIRIFHGGDHGKHRHLLFNLREDLGENTNLAQTRTDLVNELDERIETFLKESQAVRAIPNPRFDPAQYHPENEGKPRLRRKPAPKSAGNTKRDPGDIPALKGWKARGCVVAVKEGFVTITPQGKDPFLGVVGGKLDDQSTLTFRIKADAGQGKVDWLPGGIPNAAKAKSVTYSVTENGWSEITVKLPSKLGEAGILRLYLPTKTSTLELDWIELKTSTRTERWDFGK